MTNWDDVYFRMFERAVLSSDPEEALNEAADLGRKFVKNGILPEDCVSLHQDALCRLAREHPEILLSQVAGRLTTPLLETSVAYSFAYRQQRDRKILDNNRQAQASRLEAIGTMAAGIAHDFNTILGIINGYTELIEDLFPESAEGRDYTFQILDASARAHDLIAQMLAFARQTPVELIVVDAVTLIQTMLQMLRVSVPSSIEINFQTELESAPILAAKLQIEQIVMNLSMNAVDAMENHGRLDILITSAPALMSTDGSSINRFCIVIDDNGSGMSPEVQQRVLDPFFTTKEPGKGKGLGLSVVYGIVSDLGGDIQIYSEIGMGSRFHIFLPLKNPDSDNVFLNI